MLNIIFALLLSTFFNIKTETHTENQSDHQKNYSSQEKETYQKYFEEQEQTYKDLLELSIPGVRRLKIDETLAKEMLTNCPQAVNDLVSDIEQSVFCIDRKNTLLQGVHGTGKSCLAQAVAIKTQSPCLFLDAEMVFAESMKSGLEVFEKIFQQAENLEKEEKKPSVIIFDKLEALTKKDATKNNQENSTLIDFWGRLNDLNHSRVVTIGTMDGVGYLPVQITSQTSVITISLPEFKQREKILAYYFKVMQDKYGIIYSESVTPAILAKQTNGFTHRQLQNLMEELTNPVIKMRNKGEKNVIVDKLPVLIKSIQKKSKRKLVPTIKRCLPGSINPFVVLGAIGLFNQGRGFDLQEKGLGMQERGLDIQERGLEQAAEIAKKQREQVQSNFDYQTGLPHMAKQAACNLPGTIINGLMRYFLG